MLMVPLGFISRKNHMAELFRSAAHMYWASSARHTMAFGDRSDIGQKGTRLAS